MRVLHPTDFSSAAELARGLALDLCARLSAELHLVHVLRPDPEVGIRARLAKVDAGLRPLVDDERQARSERQRERLQGLAGEGGTFELLWGEPLKELIRLSSAFDLVVMGAHGHSSVDDAFLGGIAGRLVRRSRTPVLTVRDTCPVDGVRRLLVANDSGEASLAAWRFALRLAERGGFRLVLAHALEHADRDLEGERARLESLAAGRAERLAVRQGSPIDVLPAIAQDVGADAIVMGLRPQRRAGLIRGSSADALLRSSTIPVLSVPFG
jgi:nucleotide-binding universal stress UspA family protein